MQYNYTALPTSPREITANGGIRAISKEAPLMTSGSRDQRFTGDPSDLLEARGRAHAAALQASKRFDAHSVIATWTLHPQNPVFGIWNPLMSVVILVDCFVQPFRGTFMRFLQQKYLVTFLYRFSSFAWIMYLCDTFFQLFIQVPKSDGTGMLSSSSQVIRAYLRSDGFRLDIITLIPWHLIHEFTTESEIALGVGAESRGAFELIVDMLPVLRLVRLSTATRLLYRYRNVVHISFATNTLVQCGFGLTLSLHLLACMWSLVGLENPLQEEQTWIQHYYREYESFYPTAVQTYLASLYWALATTTSIGYGDVVPAPASSMEQFVCVILMCIAALIWSVIIAHAVELVKELHGSQEDYQKTMDLCHSVFVANPHLSPLLTESIREFFKKSHEMDMQASTQALIGRMSPMLQRHVVQGIYAEWIEDIPWVASMSGPCLVRVVLRMQNFLYIPGEVIPDARMTQFVHLGSLFIGGRILGKGDCWAVDMTMEGSMRRAESGFAMNFVSTLGLTFRNLIDVLEDFPEDAWRVKRVSCWMAVRRKVRQITAASRREKRGHAMERAMTTTQDTKTGQEFGQLSDDARYTVKMMTVCFEEQKVFHEMTRKANEQLSSTTADVKTRQQTLEATVASNSVSLSSVEKRLTGIEASMTKILSLLQDDAKSPTKSSSLFKR